MSIYIAFGSNKALGALDPRSVLSRALTALPPQGVEVRALSRFWRSPAWPDPADPPYLNGAAELVTRMSPETLLACLHAVEARFGRERRELNAPRTLDLDIIDYEGRVSAPGDVPVLPHPRATQRAFVLLPLREIAPDWTDPVSGQGIEALIAGLDGADVEATVPVS
ncbi:MAG: 2-amino-4-hydroxy-6-hydroxymethyldihydropteridine diphosphokinase [Glycocaulis sp.]